MPYAYCRSALAATLVALGPAHAAQAQTEETYRFAAAKSEAQNVSLVATDTGASWQWAAPARAGWDTALLGVRVDAGSEPEPWVEVAAGSARTTLYLDAGAHGARWLNLSALKSQLSGGTAVEIKAHGVGVEAGASTLRVFANHLDLSKTMLIVAPHPDDAEIASFGLYAGRNATIVTLTSGNAGDANYQDYFTDAAEQYLFKGFLRAVDSVTVPLQGGIPPERCYNLGYFDARLATMHGKPNEVIPELYGPNTDVAPYRRANVSPLLPNTSRTNTWTHLVEDLLTILKKVKPQIVVMPHPQLDTHLDHEFASVALVEALERYKKPASFLLYTNHSMQDLFPFGPAGTGMSLPPVATSGLPVESVYSHTVSADLQRRKLFALESMHDLRLSPSEQNGCRPPGSLPKRSDYPREASVDYLRRGPRAEELFFVFGRDGVRDLIHAFLDKRAAQ
jgi:LmbE family N-acetylglucosaminyl deacetylase